MMTVGAMDNGFLIFVGERFAGYIAYAVWGAAKRVKVEDRSLFDVLRELFYDGGNAGEYLPTFAAFRDTVAADLIRLDDERGNPYFPVPGGGRVKLREGRHGSIWGLYEALCGISRMCELYPEDALEIERIAENEEV